MGLASLRKKESSSQGQYEQPLSSLCVLVGGHDVCDGSSLGSSLHSHHLKAACPQVIEEQMKTHSYIPEIFTEQRLYARCYSGKAGSPASLDRQAAHPHGAFRLVRE